MFVFLYSWIIYLPYHLVHIGRGPWVQTEKVMDLQNLNKLERVCSIWCHPKTRTRRIGWDVWMLIVVILRRACIFYKFIWSTDDSSWVVACSCCRVFSIKCGFNIIIIYMFSFLVEWWISTLVVASDLLLLVVYLLHPCMGRALPSWAEKHV